MKKIFIFSMVVIYSDAAGEIGGRSAFFWYEALGNIQVPAYPFEYVPPFISSPVVQDAVDILTESFAF